MHLNQALWQRLLRGTLEGDDLVQVRAHLAAPCEACEAFLESQGPDALDAALDAAAASPAMPEDAVWAKVEAAIAPRVLRPRQWAGAGAGFVAGCLATAAMALVLTHQAPLSFREKGGQSPVGLTAIVASKGSDGQVRLRPLEAGHVYHPSDEVFLTYQLPSAAYVYLGRAGATSERFYPPQEPGGPEPEGVRPLAVDGVVHAYSLEGLEGAQHLVLVASPTPLSQAQVLSAIERRSLEGGSVASVFLKVEP